MSGKDVYCQSDCQYKRGCNDDCDPEVNEDIEKSYTDLLAEELELQETVTVENQQRTVWVNCRDAAIPFGSYKMSGHRRGLPFLPYPQLPRMSRRRR